MDVTGRIFDLSLEPISSEHDCVDPKLEADAIAAWIEDYLLDPQCIEALPELHGVGKTRFICIASILIAIRPALETWLRVIADEHMPRAKNKSD